MKARRRHRDTRDRLQLTLDALNAIAQNLKSLPGRKNLIWVSEGFPFSIEPGTIVNARDHVSGRNYTVSNQFYRERAF